MNTHFVIKIIFPLLFLSFGLMGQDCPPADTIQVNPPQDLWSIPNQNNWNGLEVMTWNVKEFPLSSNTENYVSEIMSDILPDIIAFQEIGDIQDYENFASMNPAHNFIHTNYNSEVNPDLGIAVRNDCVEIDNYTTLFSSEGWAFAYRYPLKAELQWGCGDAAINIHLINIHMKAFDEGFSQRLAASQVLADYIQSNISENIIIAGDFNDEIDEPENNNSLWPLVEDQNCYFTTTPIAGNNYYNSFPWGMYASFIDHILISAELFDENSLSGEVQTLRIDDYTGSSTYQYYISDHRPVIWKINVDVVEFSTGLVINEIMNNPVNVTDSYGEWLEVINTGAETIDLNGIILRDGGDDQHTISQVGGLLLVPGEFLVLGGNDNPAENGGINVDYVYSNFSLGNGWDEVILEHPTGEVLDEVWYDNGASFPDPSGASMMLDDPGSDNNNGVHWSTSTQSFGDGDLGTPGAPNNSSGTILEIENIAGWNLIGLPLEIIDGNYQIIFPGSILGTLYGYNGTYFNEENLTSGSGYWLRFDSDGSSLVEGMVINSLAIELVEGWNLITGITNAIPVEFILDPNGIIVPGTIYEYSGSYGSANTIAPGRGYWIRTNSAGDIVLTAE